MIRNITIVGGGSAGFIAAIALKRKLPSLQVQLLRSPSIGIIGVGEGTTAIFAKFFFEQLGLKPAAFYARAEPTWKLGIRFLWGPRPYFHYSFTKPIASRLPGLERNTGFYLEDNFANADVWHSLMEAGRAVPRTEKGQPAFFNHAALAFHIENKKLVDFLEQMARELGVQIRDAEVEHVLAGEAGVDALVLEGGERFTADLYVDASGFRSELLGRALGVPFKSYADALLCDRAVIAAWPRTSEPIQPYTVAETMDHGWCWQIEHEHLINRGYVYSGNFVDDDTAREEYLRKNPKANPEATRVVKFRSGRYETMWKKNVVAIGNSAGFVEPLEATSLQVIILQSRSLADCLIDSLQRPTPTVRDFYNRVITSSWDEIRDFLAVHYKFNTRLETPFWKTCREEISLGAGQAVHDFYVENGPSALAANFLLSPQDPFGVEGYFAMLVGQRVPHQRMGEINAADFAAWRRVARENESIAAAGFTVKEALARIRQPGWSWS